MIQPINTWLASRSEPWIETVEVQLCKWTDSHELRAIVGYEDQLARLVAMRKRREARATAPKYARILELKMTFAGRSQFRRALDHWWPDMERPYPQNAASPSEVLLDNLDIANKSVDLQQVESTWIMSGKDPVREAPELSIAASPRQPLPNVFVSQQIDAINRLLQNDAAPAKSGDARLVTAAPADLVDDEDPLLVHVPPGDVLAT
jgi:hypothetical protein